MLGKVSPLNSLDTLLYKVPVNKMATLGVSITNRTMTPTDVTISIIEPDDMSVSSIAVLNKGTGLTDFPTLTISGADGDSATATVTSLSLTSFVISNGGTNYEVGSRVQVNGGSATPPAILRVTEVDGLGAVVNAVVDTGYPASAYTAVITGTTTSTTVISGPGGGLTLAVSGIRYGINTVSLSNGGYNYIGSPTVIPSAGTGAQFSVTMTTAQIESGDALEYRVTLGPSGVLERTGLLLNAGDALFVKSSVAGSINAFAYGIETLA